MDDAICERAPAGVHRFELVELTAAGPGLAQVHQCSWCGVQAYEASAADDPRREA